jgi:hypothetical protein
MRNRVNVVKAYAELLIRSDALDEKSRRYAEKIRGGMISLMAFVESADKQAPEVTAREACQ